MKKSLPLLCKIHCTLLLFIFINITSAQCVPNFGNAANYTLFTISGAVGNTAVSNITGDIGTNTGAITGFEAPTVVNGVLHLPDANTAQASTDLMIAANQLFAETSTNTTHAPSFGTGETLAPGVYAIGSAGSIAGNLTLDGGGNPNAIFIFKINGAFTTAAGTTIIATNGTDPANIFWVANGAIAMGASTTMLGTMIAIDGAVSMGDLGSLHGKLFSTTGAIAVYGNIVSGEGIEIGNANGGILSSNQVLCSGIPSDLTLSGYSGAIVKWQISTDNTFTSATDIANTTSTLTGLSIGNLNTTTYFRALIEKAGCVANTAYSSVVTITTSPTSWNGTSWSNGNPSAEKSVTISGNYTSSGNMEACALHIINAAIVTILGGNSVTLDGALLVDSDSHFILNKNANLIQISEVPNSGTITVEKTTAPLNRLDYILWSSPVSGQFLQSFSPGTLPNRFYTYNASSNQYVVVPSPATSYFDAGTSRLIRLPNTQPITPTVWDGSFSGIPNNGIVSLVTLQNKYYAVGNPYPSGINANLFIAQNNITEPLYFWRKTNNATNSSYAVYTTAGGISNSGSDPLNLTPGLIIPVGQGFIAKSANTSLIFTNGMRMAAINSPLLRTTAETSRIWLNITNSNGFFGQQLIAYIPEATIGIDDAIDGRFFNDSQTAFTSMIDDQEFSIQGRPSPFDFSDVVALGFKSEIATSFTISINHLDGVFTGEQAVYLRDNTMHTLTDLKLTAYTFSTEAGVFNNRFELVYQNALAVNPQQLDATSVVIYKQNSNLIIKTGLTVIDNVKVFDIFGRLLVEKDNVDATETNIAMTIANQVLIVKITSDQKEVVSKKVVY